MYGRLCLRVKLVDPRVFDVFSSLSSEMGTTRVLNRFSPRRLSRPSVFLLLFLFEPGY